MDKVKGVDFHVRQTLVSISDEISRHFSFLHIVHHMVEMTLEFLFQTVLGLIYILFIASPAGDAVDQVVAVARHVVFCAVFSACYGGHYMAFRVQQGTISALTVGASVVGRLGRFALLCDRGEFRPYQ